MKAHPLDAENHACLLRVAEHNPRDNTYLIEAVGFSGTDERWFPAYSKSNPPDFPSFECPALLLPLLIGTSGQPDDLVGLVYAADVKR